MIQGMIRVLDRRDVLGQSHLRILKVHGLPLDHGHALCARSVVCRVTEYQPFGWINARKA